MSETRKVSKATLKRIDKARKAAGLTQKALGDRIGCTQGNVSEMLSGKRSIGVYMLGEIAKAVNRSTFWLLGLPAPEPASLDTLALPGQFKDNPKPIRLGDVLVDTVFLLAGNHTKALDFQVRYQPIPLEIPLDVRPHLAALVGKTRAKAAAAKAPFFNGPVARLLCISQDNARHLPSGEEAAGFVFELGPLSWYEYTALNNHLDENLFPGEIDNTIRKKYADVNQLYFNGPDLRWCQLSNVFNVSMVPVTTDGFGLIQRRSRTGTSVAGGKLISGISENIHRYLDEAPVHAQHIRANPIETATSWAARSAPRDYLYQPRPDRVPSPILTAQRGVYEELSERLYEVLLGASARFKFLNVIMALDYFHPYLIGVIELPLTRDELVKMIQESPGKDHGEYTNLLYVSLNPNNSETAKLLHDKGRWVAVGLSSLITAIKFWQEHHRP